MTIVMPPRRPKRPHRKKIYRATLYRIRKEVYERAGYKCVHCGWTPREVPEDYDGKYALNGSGTTRKGRPTFICLELDHIVPVVAGGDFLLENLQALCSSCNGRKGGRI